MIRRTILMSIGMASALGVLGGRYHVTLFFFAEAELDKRVEMMKDGAEPREITDQYRVYQEITSQIVRTEKPFTRLMVQASAGTGKSLT